MINSIKIWDVAHQAPGSSLQIYEKEMVEPNLLNKNLQKVIIYNIYKYENHT